MIYNEFSSFMIIPPDSSYALDLEACWEYCNSERMSDNLYTCQNQEKHLPMSSLHAVVNDGIYVIRFSVKRVLLMNENQFELMITDGTAECMMTVGTSIIDYFDGIQSMSDLVVSFT